MSSWPGQQRNLLKRRPTAKAGWYPRGRPGMFTPKRCEVSLFQSVITLKNNLALKNLSEAEATVRSNSPIFGNRQKNNFHLLHKQKEFSTFAFLKHQLQSGAVVQLVRMPACHAGGRGFESLPHRKKALDYCPRPFCFVQAVNMATRTLDLHSPEGMSSHQA